MAALALLVQGQLFAVLSGKGTAPVASRARVQRRVIGGDPFNESPLHVMMPPTARKMAKMPTGRRGAKIRFLADVIDEFVRIKASDPGIKRKHVNGRNLAWRMKEMQRNPDKTQTAQGKVEENLGLWLGKLFSLSNVWTEPLNPQEMTDLFYALDRASQNGVPVPLEGTLSYALAGADLETISAVLHGLSASKAVFPGACEIVGREAAQACVSADTDQLSVFADALAEAHESMSMVSFTRLQQGLQHDLSEVPLSSKRWLAWSCAELGEPLPGLFGSACVEVEPHIGRTTWGAISKLAEVPGAHLLSIDPAPLVSVPKAVEPRIATELLRLAETGRLWRPSARKAGTGEAIAGRPWSALLDRQEYKFNPSVNVVRLWVADALDVPCEHVEAVRLVRYRDGDVSGSAHADARPGADPSLWLSGQRIAAVLIHLDEPEHATGGEVVFPHLSSRGGEGALRVSPEAGTAIVWPTVDFNGVPETRVARQALPLNGVGAVKHVAITWVRGGPAPGQPGGMPV